MKRLFLILSAFAILLGIISCGHNKNEAGSDEIIIEGRFIHSRNDLIHIDLIHVENIESIDSIRLDENGSFVFQYKTEKPLFIRVLAAKDNFITLIAEPGEKLILSGDVKALSETYTVSGSPASALVAKHFNFTQKQYDKLDSLFSLWEKNKYAKNKLELRDRIDSLVKETEKDQKEYTQKLIEENSDNIAALFILYQKFGRKPILDEFEYFDVYQTVAENLTKKYPTNEHVNHLNAKVKKINLAIEEEKEIKARLDTGKIAPDFSHDDINKNPFSIKQLRGRVVLLHFWGSWSSESMMQLNSIRYFNKTYGPRGLSIVSVSFDFDEQTWTETVKDEKMQWINICDLKHVHSPIARLYHVEEVPYMYVLDKKGIIVNKNKSVDEIGRSLYELLY